MADKLIVKGLGKPLDGEYEFDLSDFVMVGRPGSLTMREAHRIKTMTGIRAGEIEDAIIAGDSDLLAALSAVIMTRAGKAVNEQALWDSRFGQIDWDLEVLRPKDEAAEGDADPPESPAETPETESPSTSGGKSSESTSDEKANDPSPITDPDSETSADSNRLRSVI